MHSDMPSNTARIRVGCLLEISVDAGYKTAADVDQLFAQVATEVAKLNNPRHVTVVDWRRCSLMEPKAAERLSQHMASKNAHTVRSAALANATSPLAVLQFVRVIREAGLSDRKLFFEAGEMVAWLAEVLTPEERERLWAFVNRLD